ncbi:SH3 domain-containing protein [Neptunicella marina]|uniref:SH3 domain-containing protein n=1 Tax=Neptunicella marina TaxID=2125989 RepID=A0A8J6ITI2_9ALTE|nr:SH3 domain-containing protein [Neptunicella marina]MBC3765647.1 SH3 domain-containing protein [Neptunicella marina]
MKLIKSCLCLFLLAGFQLQAQEHWKTDVVGIDYAQLEPAYWVNKLDNNDQNQVLMTREAIDGFNQQLISKNKDVVDPLNYYPEILDAEALKKLIESISSVPSSQRFYPDGDELSPQDFANYIENLNEGGIKSSNLVRYGLAVKRAMLRTFPTTDRILNRGMDADLDRFQESGLFPGDAVAILHQSKDRKWLLVQNYHYLAWVKKDAVAFADKQQIQAFKTAKPFAVITGYQVKTNYVPDSDVSQIVLDMGTRLPLLSKDELPTELYGQNPYASYAVKLPTRDQQGNLVIKPALIARHFDVSIGYLPFTKANIIRQGFKFLGERYGWGHDYNGRDCTGFVGEVYKTFGFKMPRNSGQQGGAKYGTNHRFNKQAESKDKLAVINKMQTGDLIYIPGHVMMVLGEVDGQPYVIHDVKGLGYMNAEGKLYRGTLNGVSVTPLLPLQLSVDTSYVDRIYNIKRITSDSQG